MLLSNNIDLTKKNALLLTQTRCLRDERNEVQHLLKAFTASNRAQQLEFRGQLDRFRHLLRQALSDSNQKDDQLKELQENNLQLQSLLTESLAEAFNSHHLLATVQEEGELLIQDDFEVAPDPPLLTDRLTPPHADSSSSSAATSIIEEGSSSGNKENHSPPPFSFIYHQGPSHDATIADTGTAVGNGAQVEDNSPSPTHSETASSQPDLQKNPSFGHRQAASSKEEDDDNVFSFSTATPAFNHLVAAAFQASKDVAVPKLTRIEEKGTNSNDEIDENGDGNSSRSAVFLTPSRQAAPPNKHPATGTVSFAEVTDDNDRAATGMRSSARTRDKADRVSYVLPKLNSKLRQGDPFTFGKPEDINLKTKTKGKRLSMVSGPSGGGGGGGGSASGNVSAVRKLLQDDTT
jgi:hypothetical protein